MNTITVPMLQPDAQPVLAGRLDGKRAFARTIESLPTITAPTLVVLDFKGAELATSSFLDEAVIRCRDHLRLSRSPTYLVVANLHPQIEEELNDLLVRASDAMVSCGISHDGHLDNKKMLGALEPKLNQTLELVKQKGGASAVQLHDEADVTEKKIGPTAWNNRLSSLAAKGLVVEVVQPGRTKQYRPIMETV